MTRLEQVKMLEDIANIAKVMARQQLIFNELRNVHRELALIRKGQEAGIYGEEIEEMPDVNLDDIPLREEEDA